MCNLKKNLHVWDGKYVEATEEFSKYFLIQMTSQPTKKLKSHITENHENI